MRARAAIVGALTVALAGVANAGPIESLKPGEWYEVPSSRMRAVTPKEGQFAGTWGAEGPAAVINDWSGGTYDTKRDRLIVWGGGHGGYAGDEVYVFDVATLAWKRLDDPSTPPGVDVPYAPDGRPTSRHTYDYLVYAPPPIDRFCTIAGAGFYQSGQTGTNHVDCYDFDAMKWETQRFADVGGNHIGAISAVDPVTRHLWYHAAFSANLMELDPDKNQWTQRGGSYYLDYYKTAEIDPKRKRFVAIGKGDVMSWDIGAAGTIAPTKLTTTGATDIVAAPSPGLAYDSASDRLVAWKGGADVYSLNLDTLVWTQLPPAPTNAVTPTAPNGNGTFGRFRYMPSKNAFILVNSADGSVYVYKLSAAAGVDAGPYPDVVVRDAGSSDARPAADAAAADTRVATADGPATGGADAPAGGGGRGGSGGGGAGGSVGSGGNRGGGGSGGAAGEPAATGRKASSKGSGCGCELGTVRGGGGLAWVLLVLVAVARRRSGAPDLASEERS
jgi:uncharacterized membrane protein YgcG